MQHFYPDYKLLSLFVKSKWNLLHLIHKLLFYAPLSLDLGVTIFYFSILDYYGEEEKRIKNFGLIDLYRKRYANICYHLQ